MTQLRRILEALAEAPGTAPEIAAELDLPCNVVRARLSQLHRAGLVERAGSLPPPGLKDHRSTVLYRARVCAPVSSGVTLAQTSARNACA